MARPEGLEPPTTWFEARCSIQLSYGRAAKGSAGSPIASKRIRPPKNCESYRGETIFVMNNPSKDMLVSCRYRSSLANGILAMRFLRQSVAASMLVGSALVTSSVVAQDLSAIPSGTYVVDPTHAYINFSYNHLGLSNPTLAFDDFDITVELDVDDPTQSTIAVTIDPASVVAGSDIWKEHLTGDKWFDVAAHPEITFASTSVEAGDAGALKVMGDLTIKGTSQPVVLDVNINGAMPHPRSGVPMLGISATTEVLRSDFGMGAAAPAVGDEVAIEVTAELENK